MTLTLKCTELNIIMRNLFVSCKLCFLLGAMTSLYPVPTSAQTSVSAEEKAAGCPWYLDKAQLQEDYLKAVADAAVAEPGEICYTLPAITFPGDRPGQEWTTDAGRDMILVGSMTNAADAEKWTPGDAFRQDDSLPWVTLPADLEEHLRRVPHCTDSLECRMRMLQMLGLPPDCDNDRIVFFYVAPEGLFRPSPDPEVNDNHASLHFPDSVPQHYRQWFAANITFSYHSATPYPWTRLGYTYDWHRGAATVQGPGEFIVHPGAWVRLKRKVTVWTWYNELF